MFSTKKVYALIVAALAAAAIITSLSLYFYYRTSTPAWTFAFYLDGSGSLLLEQQRNLREIIRGSRGLQHATVVVYCDRGPAPRAPMFYAWKGPRIFHVKGTYNETLSHPVLPRLPQSVEKPRFEELLLKGLPAPEARLFERHYTLQRGRYVLNATDLPPEQGQAMLAALQKSGYLFGADTPADTVSAASMSRFFSLVRDNYPARHYAFFIAGHGLGWFSGRSLKPAPQTAAADTLNKSFHAEAIHKGLIHNEPDILCLDLCLMADLESVYRLRHSAGYLVLGQGPIPSSGQDYGYLFEHLAEKRASRPDAMARAVFASAAHALDKSRLNSAIALIKTGPKIDTFIDDFAAMLSDAGPQRMNAALQQTNLRLPPWGGLAHEMIDLKGLIKAVQTTSGIKGPDPSAFLLNTHATSKKISGLSIYYPQSTRIYLANRDEYAGLDFTHATGKRWLALLDSRHGPSLD